MGSRVSKHGVARLSWKIALPISIMVGFLVWMIGTLVGLTTQNGMFWSMEIAATSAAGAFFLWAIYRLATGRDDGLSFFVTVVLAPAVRSANHDPGPIGVWAIQAVYCCVLRICCLAVTRFRPEWGDELILGAKPQHLRPNDTSVDDSELDQVPI
jgi:hypothetical protein